MVASYYLQPGKAASLFSKKTISKKVKKKDKWRSIRHKQANDIYSAKINKRIKGTVQQKQTKEEQNSLKLKQKNTKC